MRDLVRRPYDDLVRCLEQVADAPRPALSLGLALAGLTASWFVYVPIHELLHVAGCVWTGGSVSQLEIQAEYGGALLARFFDFVVIGGEYSGRLSGFDTHGSDLVYLSTVFAPYLLSIMAGVPLLRLCTTRNRPVLLGIGIVVGLAPFYSFVGDYYEMSSILVTRILTWLTGGGHPPIFEALRSDDVIALVGTFVRAPDELGLETGGRRLMGATVIASSLVGSIALGLGTYGLGGRFAELIGIPAAAPTAQSDELDGADESDDDAAPRLGD